MKWVAILALIVVISHASTKCAQTGGRCEGKTACSGGTQHSMLCPGKDICCFRDSAKLYANLLKEGFDYTMVRSVVGREFASVAEMRRSLVSVKPFTGACEGEGDRITIGAVGDILPHDKVQLNAYHRTPSFAKLMEVSQKYIDSVDIMYGNLETNVAGAITYSGKKCSNTAPHYDGKCFTGYPKFNTHEILLRDLKEMGFDVLSTSNNHALDRKSVGVDNTIDNLRKYNLKFTGTRRSDEPDVDDSWYTIVEKPGWRIAFLACTFSTNQLKDPKQQVQMCYARGKAHPRMLELIKKLSERDDIDAVIVTPHWGDVEKKVTVNDKEIAAGHAFIDAGATALLGTHVHIPQRCENYKNRLICYSSGNWLSKYSGQYTRIGLFYKLGLRKVNGKVVTDAFNWAPFDQGSNSKLGPVQSRSVGWLNKMFGGERALKAGTEQVDLTPAECSTYN